MKVQAISGVNYRGLSNVSFKNNEEDRPQSRVSDSIRSKAVTVPVIVLLAANPATLNSSIPARELESNKISVVEAPEKSEAAEATYTDFPMVEASQQSDAPFGWKSLNTIYVIKKSFSAKTSFGPADVVFATNISSRYNRNRDVSHVFIILRGLKTAANPYADPPKVNEIVYHRTGDGKDFYGAKIVKSNLDDNRAETGYSKMEWKIDDNSAREIIKLLNNNTQWNNATSIDYSETSSPQKMKMSTVNY